MVASLGECPAATSMNYDGTNDGVAAGRVCWMIRSSSNRLTGSNICSGISCQNCDFYRRVRYEEKASVKLQLRDTLADPSEQPNHLSGNTKIA